MRRRELILLLGGELIAPRALRAQQKAMPIIGFLGVSSPGPTAPYVAAFEQGLSEAGWVEGKNVTIEFRWAEARYDRLPALAADLVGRKVDVIVAFGGIPAALAAKSATSTIPIVFSVGDPVELGLVASLARSGGNVTGVSTMAPELISKRLELLSELVPQAGVIALLVNPNNSNTERIIGDMQEAAHTKGVQLPVLKAGSESENFRLPRRSACRRAHRRRRSVLQQPARAARGAGGTPCGSCDLCLARIRRFRRPDQLWPEHLG
jgi:putative tryptophan/tyrosine transport system substrate-binding protein